MKGIDLFCASPASTAICVSLDQTSMIRSSSRAIDRHTPRLIDSRRAKKPPNPPSHSAPKPKAYHPKPRKSSAKQTEFTSPPGSSRYLLSDSAFFDVFNDFDPVSALVPVQPSVASSSSKSLPEAAPFRPSPPPRSHEQVVVLRVSLHCKGCEGKVRKHISRMEGVKSFNIDFPTKKVTVIGDVTPLGVLASISRVKNAQFWPSPPSSSSFSPSLRHTVLQRY